MKRYLIALVSALTFSAYAYPVGYTTADVQVTACAKPHAPYGLPTSTRAVKPLCRGGYFTLYDLKAKVPAVSVYVLTADEVRTACAKRDSSFSVDKDVPEASRSTGKDYAKSGYDIGHLVPAEDLRYSPEAQGSAALFTNAAPMLPIFNRGVWKRLEDTTRVWAVTSGALTIYVGTIVGSNDSTIGSNVTVPGAFFKVLVDESGAVQAYMFKHEGSKEKLESFNAPVAEIERLGQVKLPLPGGAKQVAPPAKGQRQAKECAL